MKLKRLELYGFKSFPYRVEVSFPPGICAIVGPNGSGKSNIVDAVRWVLGEQSPRRLRAREMEDVIFSGSNGRGPNFAEVRLIIENEGDAPGDLADLPEIVITRRLYRSGESEYLLNGRPCRLKDIHYLFMDTGAGHRAYAIIDQGEVGSFVELRPEERRLLIEEVAGVSRYKARREEAQRRIKASLENLTRLEDILAEVKRQRSSLKRQARKAEKYLRLKEELRRLDVVFAAQRLKLARDKIRNLSKEQETLSQQEALLSTRRQTLETEKARLVLLLSEKEEALGQIRQKEEAAREKLREAAQHQEALKGEIKALETRIKSAQAREKELTGRHQTLRKRFLDLDERLKGTEAALKEIEEKEDRLAKKRHQKEEQYRAQRLILEEKKKDFDSLILRQRELEAEERRLESEGNRQRRLFKQIAAELEELSLKLKESEERISSFKEEKSRLENELTGLSRDLGDLYLKEKKLSAAEEHLKEAISELKRGLKDLRAEAERLRRLEAEMAGLPPSARFIKENLGLGLLVEAIKPATGWEAALTAVVSEGLGFALVDDLPEAKEVIEALREARLGTGGVILRRTFQGEAKGLLEKVERVPEALARVLTAFFLEESLETALRRYLSDGDDLRLASKDGIVFWPGGMIKVLSSSEGQEVLERRRRLEELASLEAKEEGRLRGLQEDLERTRQVREEVHKSLSGLKEKEAVLKRRLLSLEKDLAGLEARVLGLRERYQAVAARARDSEGRQEEIQTELQKIRFKKEGIIKEVSHLEDRLKAFVAREKDLSSLLKEISQRLEAVRLSRARLEERRRQFLDEKKRLEKSLGQTQEQRQRVAEELKGYEPKLSTLKEALVEEKSRVANLQEELVRLQAHRKHLEEELSGLRGRLSSQEADIRATEAELRRIAEGKHHLDLEITELRLLADHLKGKIAEKYQLDLDNLDPAFLLDEAPDEETFSRRVAEIKEELSRLGAVNLAAVEEYQGVEERLEFLNSQKADLLEAIESLKEAISKINRLCRQKIREAVAEVNKKLKEVFPLLFEGGTAELRLVGSDDPLEAGLDLYIRLPGKRLQHLGLLSGGEKALSALAVVFAVFLTKPSPFCLLDEVDAPLDETNTLKFNRLVKEIARHAQVIIITHNQRVMEAADTLYGITMEEKGISKIVSVKLAEAQG